MEYSVSEWHGFKRSDFVLNGRKAIIVEPQKREENNRWLLKTEYFDAFPSLETEMLKRGWCVAYIENITRWHKPEDDDAKAELDDAQKQISDGEAELASAAEDIADGEKQLTEASRA